MPVDPAPVGETAARLMDGLDSKYDESAQLQNVIILATVEHSNGASTTVEFAVNGDIAKHTLLGILEQVKHEALNNW